MDPFPVLERMMYNNQLCCINFFQTFQVISEAGKTDEHKRRELCRLHKDTREVLNALDDDFSLQKRLGDFRTTLEENIQNLEPRDQYVVLVAGN